MRQCLTHNKSTLITRQYYAAYGQHCLEELAIIWSNYLVHITGNYEIVRWSEEPSRVSVSETKMAGAPPRQTASHPQEIVL